MVLMAQSPMFAISWVDLLLVQDGIGLDESSELFVGIRDPLSAALNSQPMRSYTNNFVYLSQSPRANLRGARLTLDASVHE